MRHRISLEHQVARAAGAGTVAALEGSGVHHLAWLCQFSIWPPLTNASSRDSVMTRHYKSIPIKLEFSIPRTNVSGLSIASMDIKNIKYKASKAVRMETTAGIYEMRM